MLYLEEFEDWEAKDYVENLYQCFRASGTYKEKVIRGKRCVKIDYAGDFRIDVVPYMERNDKKYITYRPDNEFELTNPEAYNAWLDEKNSTANGHLVKVIRVVKFLRDFKNTFHVKSVVLNVLFGDQVNDVALLENPECYSDVPTTLRTVMNRLSEYVSNNEILPSIIDPSGTGENLSDRWNQEEFASFRKAIIRYAEWIDDAWSDMDFSSSRQKWQRVFGEGFGQSEASNTTEAMVKSVAALPVFSNTEQNLEDASILLKINAKYAFRIGGKVLKNERMGAYYLRKRGNRVMSGRKIKFEVEECNVPAPFKIYWKVHNRGDEAIKRDCIRGQIEEGDRVWRINESTSFGGSHYVECYIVKDGYCVAKSRQPVNISYFN